MGIMDMFKKKNANKNVQQVVDDKPQYKIIKVMENGKEVDIRVRVPSDADSIKSTITGTKIPKRMNPIHEEGVYLAHNIDLTRQFFKLSFVLDGLTFLFVIATALMLFFKPDSEFYATSPNGTVVKLNARTSPEGSFKIQPLVKTDDIVSKTERGK